MTNNNIKAIVWDLDGTLIHFKIDWLRARREAIKILKSEGVPKKLLTIRNSILDNVRLARAYFKSVDHEPDKIEKIITEVDHVVNEIEYEAALEATAVNGIEQVLKYLQKKGLKQAIYTFNTNRNARTSLEKTNLICFFDVIIGRDSVKNAKPHPEHLSLICKKLYVNPSDIIVIGDNHRDIEGAINVGAKSIAIKTKLAKLTNLDILEKADKIINEKEIPLKLIKAIEDLY
ncbi:MAG: HAD family hydrolase [Promethearchaeota archaeon]|nr:MAG: HAD family hydrolase [Candidatus Lokiarchaeota archaeon]